MCIIAAKLRRLRAPLPMSVKGRLCMTDRLNGIWLPDVVPVITSRPPGLRLARLSSHTLAPTQSNTTSTPRPSVSSFTRWLNFGVVV
jgi:hypothetical protein